MDVKPGVRVVRGPDWSWEDQDGGEGNVGTVVEVKDSASEGEESGPGGTTVIVCWDGGVVTNYRCGFGGKYDLRTFDNGQTGVSHPMVTCDGCSTSPVYGMRWKCATCYDYDLCTECYMSNKHSLEHRFLRYDTPRSERVPVPARSGGRRVKAKGLFKGAAVSRGKDWNWGDQDGGIGHTGVVQCIQGWQTESQRSVGKVQWGSSDTSNVYRLGHKGKVDLKCDTPGDGGEYYPDHLPMSGAPPGPPPGTDDAATVGSGDRVKVALDLEVFKTMQEGHGGWNDKMKECLEKTGIVHSVLDSGDVRVVYGERAWTLNPASIVRVSEGHRAIHKPPSTTDTEPSQTSVLPGGNPSSSTARTEATTSMTSSNSSQGGSQRPGTSSMDLQLGFHVYRTGDVVRVLDDLALVHQLQDGHGGWNDDMALSLGQLGRVMNVFGSGDCRVKVNGYMWTLNPKALVPAPGESPPDVPDQMRSDLDMGLHMRLLSMLGHSATAVTAAAAGDIETLKNFLSKKPEAVDETIGDKTALQVAAGNGNLEIARILLQYKASVNVQDEDGDRPLHVCAFNSSTDVAELLLQHGANPNLKNHRGMTALLIATARGNIRMVKAMLGAREVDPSIQDGDGDTALHLACRERNVEAAKLLLDAGADPAITNNDSFNCLHSAAMTGIERVCELIVKKYPRLLNIRKDDGFGPLHLASFNGNFSVAKALLQFDKCDIDAVCGDGRTALHLAVDKGSADIVEVLVGHGIDLSILDTSGLTALHLAVGKLSIIGITDNSPELSKICSTLSDLPSAMVGSAAVACLLVREGADLYCKGNVDITPLDICTEELVAHLTKFVKERATFHGSLRKSPKPTPADLVEEKDTHTSPRKAEKPERQTAQGVESKLVSKLKVAEKSEDQGRVLGRKGDATIVKTTPTDTPTTASPDSHIPKTVSPVLPDDDEACLLCDRPVDVRIEPCGHTVLCRSHANTAKRCPQCRGPIHSIADLEPLCGMCQENVCSVTLKPCDHMMCSACALLMKRCFECKTKITSKIGLDEATAVKSESDPTSITTTDSSVSISDESILCEICVSNKKNTAFTCGHQLCYDCSLKVDKCPICREEIKHRIKLH